CSVTGGLNQTIPGDDDKAFSYACTYSVAPSSTTEVNTATVAWPQQTLAGGEALAAGNVKPTATVDWSAVTPTLIDNSVTVTDPLGGGTIGTVSSTDPSPTQLKYSYEVTGTPGKCVPQDNTATITTNTSGTKDTASQSVELCVGADLAVTKNA